MISGFGKRLINYFNPGDHLLKFMLICLCSNRINWGADNSKSNTQ